jgi:hypothetical protein
LIDADKPERARQDIPPATRRLVWARDRGRCRVPGCRSTRGLDLHHLEHQEHGGTHEPSNLEIRSQIETDRVSAQIRGALATSLTRTRK